MASNLIVDIDRFTGDLISGWPRCEQSIYVILTTRLRTRLMRLWWGSDYSETMDRPMNDEVFAKGIASALEYINLYETEYQSKSLEMKPNADGSCVCIIDGIYIPDQSNRTVNVTLIAL